MWFLDIFKLSLRSGMCPDESLDAIKMEPSREEERENLRTTKDEANGVLKRKHDLRKLGLDQERHLTSGRIGLWWFAAKHYL